ncbi:hypothetical protein ACF07Y_02875 [Streptomyces sp. NPDC016566]|uniref:hypothetical protein n=1 Tax=Streptomyces sp. NPDC016566 TaxID=3364967 RepID=UPI0036F6FDDF
MNSSDEQFRRRAARHAASAATTRSAGPGPPRGARSPPHLAHLVGDHHVHSVYSHDAKYTFSQQAQAAAKYGLDWMVFNEHANFGHARYGAALEHQEILKARAENPRQLVFQGLEWYIPAPEIMIGMEGAPGAQGAAIPGRRGSTSIRGEYENKPSANSFAGYPADAYLTYGGFDWAAATVGGLWDSMLAEGRLFSITTNSDNHRTVFDTWKNGDWQPGQNFDDTGRLPDPVDTDTPQPGSDFWPGEFSRTHVGVTRYGYRAVMTGLRAGRVWLDHGHLLDGLDVRLKRDCDFGRGVTLGGRLRVRRGERITLYVTVTTASRANPQGILPELAHVDVIRGAVRGALADRDSWQAPDTKVVRSKDVSGRNGTYTLRIPLTAGDESFYVRLRGSDGHRHGAGYLGAAIDPHGPVTHEPGNGDPWADTWFYSNPIFVDVAGV